MEHERTRLEERMLWKEAGELRRQERWLDLSIVLIRDLDNHIVFWSRGAQRLYGFEPHEALGMSLHDRLQTVYPRPLPEIETMLMREGTWHGELLHRRKDGRIVVVMSHWIIQQNDAGEPVSILEINADITERKQAEKTFRHHEGKCEGLDVGVPARIFYLDLERRYRSVNDAFTAWFGLSKDHIVGLPVQELVGEQAWDIIRPRLDQAYAGELVDYETEIPYRHGGTRWIHAVYTPHRDPEGAVLGVGVLVTDITAQKRAEADLQVSEERYQYIFETVGVAIFEEDWTAVCRFLGDLRAGGVTDLREHLEKHPGLVMDALQRIKITDVNGYTLHLFKAKSKVDVLGALDRIFVPQTVDVFGEELIAVWEGRDIYRARAPLRTLDGEDLSVLFTLVVPKRDCDWQRVMVTVTDVTALHHTEDALRKSEQHLRTALAAGHMGAWDIDMATGTMTWDEKHFDLFGVEDDRTPKSVERFFSLLHPDDRERVMNGMIAIEVTGRFSEEFRIVRPDGGVRWISGQGALVTDHKGSPIRVIGVHSDITARKTAQVRLVHFAEELERQVVERTAELLKSQERLRALATELTLTEQRERQRFAAQLHDHLQQLLVMCKFKLGRGKRLVQSMPSGLQLLEELDETVSHALAYSRSLVAELSPPVLRAYGLVAGIKWLAEWIQKMNLSVSVETQEEHIPLPEAHAVLLFQSVRELLINAAKYAGTDCAAVRMDVRENRLIIEVVDRGTGFDPGALAMHRASSGDLSSKFGLLSIHERMTALGGTLEIRSGVGKGTQAILTLPIAVPLYSRKHTAGEHEKPISPAVSQPTDRRHARRGTPIRLLLVDDHAIVREGLRSLLGSYADVEIVGEACNGEEAVEAVERIQPHVVVMDVNMPGVNGVEATSKIKARYPSINIIGLSINADRESSIAMVRAGAMMLITKEAAVDKLYQAIHEAVQFM
ncbi:MAG TPA: PAS domain S-box protein [Nitrospira sp.]|nr:PAS domain S-box protein [Nitrospira sp.]